MNDTDKVRFDLANGSVRAGEGERLVLMPTSALEQLGKSAGVEVACGLSRTLGAAAGMAVLAHFGSSEAVRAAALEAVVEALGAELALSGWGAVSLERWGRAMVMRVEHAPVEEGQYVAALLEGALREATGRTVRCLSLGKDAAGRYLVASERAYGRARDWLADGVAWGEVLSRLQQADADARARPGAGLVGDAPKPPGGLA
jgi:hypothetical protein